MSAEPAPALDRRQRRRRSRHKTFWKVVDPPTRRLAGVAPWWVLLETRGWRTSTLRRTPLARGPVEGNVVWLAAVHGRYASWVRNLEANPEVRIKMSRRWYTARATVQDFDADIARKFNLYARSGPRTLGIDPTLVRIERHS